MIEMRAVGGVVRRGLPRGPRFHRALVRPRTTGNAQRGGGAGAVALPPRVPPACAHLAGPRPLRPSAPRAAPPGSGSERLAPRRARWPRRLGTTAASLSRRASRRPGSPGGLAGPPAPRALLPRTPRLAPPRGAAPLSLPGAPAVGPRRPPGSAPLQPWRLARWGPHRWGPMAGGASWRVPGPRPRPGHPAGEPGRRMSRALAQEAPPWAVVDVAPRPTPWACAPDRRGAALGATTRSEGDKALGLAHAT